MLGAMVKQHAWRLGGAYSVSTAGNIAGQLYPLATGVAINGVLQQQYSAVGWLLACHFGAMVLEVWGKMLDTRVFARLYAELAGSLVIRSRREGIDPSVVAARSSLSREYVTFLERDVPGVILALVSLAVSLSALLWLEPHVAAACLALVLPLWLVNRWLAAKSLVYSERLNDRLEDEVRLLRTGRLTTVRRHFTALTHWRVRISDAEAKAFGAMELMVIGLFMVALWRLAETGEARAGDVYAVFVYVWRYVLALDQVPQLVQQWAKLKDLDLRFA